MEQVLANSMEELIRGPLVRPLDPKTGITARDYMDAINLNIMPSLSLVYDKLSSIAEVIEPEREKDEAFVYLSVLHNSIVLLDRMGEEALKDYFQRRERRDET